MESDQAVRKSVSLPPDLWDRVQDYQYAGRLVSQAEALRRLVEAGLAAVAAEREIPDNVAGQTREDSQSNE